MGRDPPFNPFDAPSYCFCLVNYIYEAPPWWLSQNFRNALKFQFVTGSICHVRLALFDSPVSILFQSENSALWLHGPGSRTMSAVPANTYYGFQGQNQQTGGFRQGQQPSQSYGSLGGYPHFYNSQAGISLDQQQQQNLRDGSLAGSQGQPKQSQQQIWQNGY